MNNDQLAAEAADQVRVAFGRPWVTTLTRDQDPIVIIIKSAIEKAYNIGAAHGYETRCADEKNFRASERDFYRFGPGASQLDRHPSDRAAHASEQQLYDALVTAKKTIFALHGDEAWEIYDQHSPEMKIINAALDAREGSSGNASTPTKGAFTSRAAPRKAAPRGEQDDTVAVDIDLHAVIQEAERQERESVSPGSEQSTEMMAEQLHVWYLEATRALDPANYNPKAQKSYAELNEQQKEIDRYIAKKVLARAAHAGENLGSTVPSRSNDTKRLELHPDTQNLVDRFSRALVEKLSKSEKKYGFTNKWLESDWMDECRENLRHHLEKGDPLDVAAFCAFLWHHGESTVGKPQSDDTKRLIGLLDEASGRLADANWRGGVSVNLSLLSRIREAIELRAAPRKE